MAKPRIACGVLALGWLILTGCTPAVEVAAQADATVQPTAGSTAASRVTIVALSPAPLAGAAQIPGATRPAPPATPTTIPTTTPTATPTVTPTPLPTLTPTPVGPCAARVPTDDDLHVLVSQTYGISREYAPGDLVPLGEVFDRDVTLGFPGEVRALIVAPLQALIAAMRAVGLQPQILSGYRSYSAQAAAYAKWLRDQPDRVGILSARPGHSEHQLGTTVDFGSPELAEIVDDPNIEFHTYFYLTNEGAWLATNAQRFGFTLSFSRESQLQSGFFLNRGTIVSSA